MKSLKINLVLFATLAFWASAFVGIRVGLTAYSPGSLALLRFLVASLCMAAIYDQFAGKHKVAWPDKLQLLLIGIGGIGIYNLCLNYGELNVSAGVASFVIGLIPTFTVVLSVIFLKERPTFIAWLGILISFTGLLLMVFSEERHEATSQGILMILISSFMGGIYTISQKRYLKHYHPVVITAWVIWGGTIMLLLFAADLWQEIKVANLEATTAAIYMGIFPAALAYVAWCYVLHNWPVSKASVYLYALPIISTLFGFLLLHEQPSFMSLGGGLIALTGALIASRFSVK